MTNKTKKISLSDFCRMNLIKLDYKLLKKENSALSSKMRITDLDRSLSICAVTQKRGKSHSTVILMLINQITPCQSNQTIKCKRDKTC